MLTIVTTCKGRLEHLRQTLPAMVGTGLPVAVVDYACPDGARHYVAGAFPQATVVTVDNEDLFNHPRARNIGAAAARTEFLWFLDCDVLIDSKGAAALHDLPLSQELFYVGGRGSLHGQCIVARSAYERVGGYDELMTGWGGDDGDLYLRLQASGCRKEILPDGIISAIAHSDLLRIRLSGADDVVKAHRLNVIYASLKRDLESLRAGKALSLEERKAIRSMTAAALQGAMSRHARRSIEWPTQPDVGLAGPLIDGSTGYSLKTVLRYEISRTGPGLIARLISAIKEGRLGAGILRRLRGGKRNPE